MQQEAEEERIEEFLIGLSFVYSILINVKYMKSKRFRSSKLSIHDEVEAGYNAQIYYCLGYYFYTLLCADCLALCLIIILITLLIRGFFML